MKLDKFGKYIASLAYHMLGIVAISAFYISPDPMNSIAFGISIVLTAVMFGLAHFTELQE